MKNITKIGGIFIALLALVLLAGATFTFAQDDSTPDTTSPQSEDGERPNGHRGEHQGIIDREAIKAAVSETLGLSMEEIEAMRADGQSMAEILEAQGVTQEDVHATVQAAVEDAVNTAVSEGTITQEEADQLLERAAEGGFGRGHRGGHRGGNGLGAEIFGDIDRKAVVAEALGITTEELEAYHEDSLRLPEIAEELGVDVADVEAAMREVVEEAVNQAVEDGTITQEQADQILSGEGRGFGHNGHRGPRGDNSQGRPFGNGNNPAANTQDA